MTVLSTLSKGKGGNGGTAGVVSSPVLPGMRPGIRDSGASARAEAAGRVSWRDADASSGRQGTGRALGKPGSRSPGRHAWRGHGEERLSLRWRPEEAGVSPCWAWLSMCCRPWGPEGFGVPGGAQMRREQLGASAGMGQALPGCAPAGTLRLWSPAQDDPATRLAGVTPEPGLAPHGFPVGAGRAAGAPWRPSL